MKISESYTAILELDSTIFMEEFNKFRELVRGEDVVNELKYVVFSFLFLQIYVEYFFHQTVRRVVSTLYRSPKPDKYEDWLKEVERLYVFSKTKEEKIRTMFLPKWLDLNHPDIEKLLNNMRPIYLDLAHIRNQLVHGHEITETYGQNGLIDISHTRALLSKEGLDEAVEKVNELGDSWNQLVDLIMMNFKQLNNRDMFTFTRI